MQSESTLLTAKGSTYIKQMCRHFAHKITVEFDDERGLANFAMGTCNMHAQPDRLVLVASAADQAALATVQQIVSVHLERFAFREELKVEWQAVA
jgi:uncharacterized protein